MNLKPNIECEKTWWYRFSIWNNYEIHEFKVYIPELSAARNQSIVVSLIVGFCVISISICVGKWPGQIEGFGELFRQLSYEEIGTSTVQSRAFGGLVNGTVIFCLPGSPSACRTGWHSIIAEQLDSNHKPCNFVDKLKVELPAE